MIQKLAEEQSLVGLVAAGIEYFTAYSLPLTEKLTLLGKSQLTEQRNEEMNRFIAELVAQLNKNGISIELHGRMPFELSRRADWVIDEVMDDSLLGIGGKQPSDRVWKNRDTDIYLPNADNDVILIFTHYLHHFLLKALV